MSVRKYERQKFGNLQPRIALHQFVGSIQSVFYAFSLYSLAIERALIFRHLL